MPILGAIASSEPLLDDERTQYTKQMVFDGMFNGYNNEACGSKILYIYPEFEYQKMYEYICDIFDHNLSGKIAYIDINFNTHTKETIVDGQSLTLFEIGQALPIYNAGRGMLWIGKDLFLYMDVAEYGILGIEYDKVKHDLVALSYDRMNPGWVEAYRPNKNEFEFFVDTLSKIDAHNDLGPVWSRI